MKLLKKIRLNIYVAWMVAAVLLAISLLFSVNFLSASADASDDMPTDITYIETEVEEIAFVQHPTCVFFGFKMTVSDYDDFGEFQGDFAGTATYETYEKYIALWLTYWKNFPQMNSEAVELDQLYAYWDGSAVGPKCANTVTHRSTLVLLEYGFVIAIPAGTTFPSATYVNGNCQGTPIMYRTTEDRAFYYDGVAFKPLDYSVAQSRMEATAELNKVNGNLYHEAERAEVEALVAAAKADIKLCLTSFTVQDRMDTFYSDLDEIMTIADFNQLSVRKEEAKAAVTVFFEGLSEALYDGEDWQKIVSICEGANAMIDSLTSFEDVEAAITSVKFAVGNVPTSEEKAALADYRATAIERIGSAFNESLYREAERAQGAALVQAGKQAVEKAATYDEVDAISAEYIAQIDALKTDAQWTAEEQESSSTDEVVEPEDSYNVVEPNSVASSSSASGGCGSVMNSIGIIFGVGVLATAMTIKKKAGKKDEE